ncbi:MAG: alpha/beta fold hydrolase [Candidatus Dormibacteraeota bacterium]|nr:alpha/beta fold hydrolase [Candidatus Dormibacteraeota bacterium]
MVGSTSARISSNPVVEAEIGFIFVRGRRVAFQLTGTGPPIVAPAWWLSNLELDARDQQQVQFWRSVAAGHSLLRYDHLGVGASDRNVSPEELTLEVEVEVLVRLVEELGLRRITLLGGSSGGPAAVRFAARFPDRVDRLLLYGAFARGAAIADAPVREAIVGTIQAHWGLGSRLLCDLFLGPAGSAERERFAVYQRETATAGTAIALLQLMYQTDVRSDVGRVRVPALVSHRRGDRAIPFRLGRELAVGIPGARLVPLDGVAHFPWAGDSRLVVRALRSVLDAGGPPAAGLAQPPAGVTERELQVLRLLARGFTDREIAEQLVVSPHTVHRHVANLRTRLGQSSRAALVAEAARRSLL